ncbi:hypothetical protein ACWDSF_06855 [Nocardia beijingensis]
MSERVFQVSDLATNRTEFIDEARSGLARLRDKDGTSLVMLPEAQLSYLQRLKELSSLLQLLNHLVATERHLSVVELGEHAWLRVFDPDDLREFATELGDALGAAQGDEDTNLADETVAAWRLTARQLADPLRKSVLHAEVRMSDLLEAERPEADDADNLSAQ